MDKISKLLHLQPLVSPFLQSEGGEGFNTVDTSRPFESKHQSPVDIAIANQRHGTQQNDNDLTRFSRILKQHGIRAQETDGKNCPPEGLMHDLAAVVPALVVSPRTGHEVAQILKLFKDLGLHWKIPLSVKSGGHGYFNGATCPGVMLNMSGMIQRRVVGDVLFLEPGCILGRTINILAENRKAVPHGDCFGVGAGGHFLTAGWDLILARRYGLGCQSVIGGRIVLWDGSIVDVDEKNHPELLYAMRGGAVAGAGVVVEIQLRLIEEPPRATWRFTWISKQQLETCIKENAFSNALKLPRDISVSFRFHFEPDQLEPVCSFNVVSLLTVDETICYLHQHLGHEVTSLVADTTHWNQKTLIDLRMLPASESLAANPEILGKVTPEELHDNPLDYWKATSTFREMARSYFTSISYWVKPGCEGMFRDLYEAFETVQEHPARERMYALIILGEGRMNELQQQCAMPLGKALARFELYWDDPEKEETWCRSFTDRISGIIQTEVDTTASRPYCGDIWLREQAEDATLDKILQTYDRRFV